MWGEGSMWLLQAVFRHARRGLMCAPPCRRCIGCVVWGLEKALMCSERRWSRIQHVG